MGLLFDLKRYALHDGPGIRTTLFLKGCPLRCVWCHNPESWSTGKQRLYKSTQCIGCSACVEACPEGALKHTPEGIRPTGRPCHTCGACADACDLLLVDLKVMDSAAHQRYTGVPNERILENLRLVATLGVPYWIRIPLIAEVNASTENLAATAALLLSLDRPPEEVDLLPYHDIGKGKHDRLGTTYNPAGLSLTAPTKEDQARCVEQLEAAGLTVKIGG